MGVGWFNNKLPASNFWGKEYFDQFYWEESFHESNPKSFENQLKLVDVIFSPDREKQPYFFFLNIATTHTPYMYKGNTPEGQRLALTETDKLFPKLIAALPRPCHYFIMADHGECFGEDGLWGHGFFHPKVMEVPFVEFILE